MHTSRRRCRKHYSLALALLLAPLQLYAQSEQKPGVADYITGVDALTTADYPRAIHALTTAITADPDNPSYRRARGIANTLNESFPDAIIDLQRAQQINPNDTEARLWLAAAYRMSNDLAKGASLFTMRDLPHDYANLVYNLMAMQYWQSRYRGAYFDPTTHTSITTTTSPIKTLFPDAAKAFADRNRATGPGVTEAITAQMKSALAANDFTTALHDLAQLRANDPDNPDLRAAYAQALLGAGNALQAREEFTRALNTQPLWPEGYLGRALAHAQLGDDRRAAFDHDASRSPAQMPQTIKPPSDAAQRFTAALQSDAPFPQLADAALALHHLTNSSRKYYDESYQDRIRLLAELRRDHPADSLYPETLARYLFNNVTVPILWNGPRADPLQLRPQSPADYNNELQRALALTDLAAKLDPKNANAFATEARILYIIKAASAEQLADQAFTVDPDNVPAMKLKVQILGDHVADLRANAAALRNGHSESHDETRSDGTYRVTTHYAPTAEQLAHAHQLDIQADQVADHQSFYRKHQQEVETQTIPALLRKNSLDAAQLALTKDPDRTETLQLLILLYATHNQTALATLYAKLTTPLETTTAAPQLQSAWTAILHTQYEAAAKLLDEAAQLDPSDARTPAYRSIIDSHRDTPDPAAARRNILAALALEEARAHESGTTLLPLEKAPTPELLTPDLAALTLALHLQAGNANLGGDAANHPDLAAPEFSANTPLQSRLPTSALTQLLPLAMLPDPTQDPNSIPPAPTLASLLANSHLGLARCYLATNHPDQAKSEFTATRAYRANWPATAPNRESLTIPDAYARLGLAELAYANHDTPQTLQILESDGWPGNLPPDLDARRKQLADQAHANLSNQSWQSVQQQMSQSPQQARIQSLQQEITQLQQQRDAIATDLKTPTLSDRDRQVRQSSIDALDQLLTQRKAILQKLQSP